MASQQGKYLGKKLSKVAERRSVLEKNGLAMDEGDEAVAAPFRYYHLGSLAYSGNAAVFDLGRFSFMGGLAAMYAWRSVYWSEQVSMRTRALLMIDWVVRCVSSDYFRFTHCMRYITDGFRRRGIWGRDLSRL